MAPGKGRKWKLQGRPQDVSSDARARVAVATCWTSSEHTLLRALLAFPAPAACEAGYPGAAGGQGICPRLGFAFDKVLVTSDFIAL